MPCASCTGWRPTSSTRSPGRSPARAAGLPGTTSASRTPLWRECRSATSAGTRRRRADHPEVGPAHPAVAQQRLDDPPRRGVHRHREPQPGARDRGVDPDDAARRVGERAAGVAGVERGVGLDDVLDHPARPPAAGGQRAGPSALTTPAVTEPARPSGLPTATTSCPTTSGPRCPPAPATAGRPAGRRAAPRGRTAGRRPPRAPAACTPSRKSARPRRASATTCAFVTSTPSPGTTTAEPLPRPIRTAATRGVTSAATALTVRE